MSDDPEETYSPEKNTGIPFDEMMKRVLDLKPDKPKKKSRPKKPSRYFIEGQGTYLKGKRAFLIHVPFQRIQRLQWGDEAQSDARRLAHALGIPDEVPILLAGPDSEGRWRVLGDPELVPLALAFVEKNPFPVEFPLRDDAIHRPLEGKD